MTTALALSRTGSSLVLERGNPEFEATCAHMAREYAEATAEIRRLAAALDVQTTRLHEAFRAEFEESSGCKFNPFSISLSQDYGRNERLESILTDFKRRAWGLLFDRLGVKKVMSVAKRNEFERKLQNGELPEITEESLVSVILGMAESAGEFARDAAKEVFGILRPSRSDYKTNSAFRVGRRVILRWSVSGSYAGKGRFRVNHSREPELIAIDGVFHVLDGKGVMPDRKGPLVTAIEGAEGGKGETDYFRFKCFGNGNLHLEFKRLDLVKQLNFLGAGEHVLGTEEM